MSVTIKGQKKLEQELERRFGKKKMQQISDKALLDGAKVFVDVLKREYASRRTKKYSKGYTVEEITISEPMWISGARTVKVYWKGPHGRYRLVHLNEWGTVKNPNPPWKGVIASAMKNAERSYREAIKRAVERGI